MWKTPFIMEAIIFHHGEEDIHFRIPPRDSPPPEVMFYPLHGPDNYYYSKEAHLPMREKVDMLGLLL